MANNYMNTTEIRKALEVLRLGHYTCEDCWYSCPKSEGGSCDDRESDQCNCGADTHNAILDAIIALLPETFDENISA